MLKDFPKIVHKQENTEIHIQKELEKVWKYSGKTGKKGKMFPCPNSTYGQGKDFFHLFCFTYGKDFKEYV